MTSGLYSSLSELRTFSSTDFCAKWKLKFFWCHVTDHASKKARVFYNSECFYSDDRSDEFCICFISIFLNCIKRVEMFYWLWVNATLKSILSNCIQICIRPYSKFILMRWWWGRFPQRTKNCDLCGPRLFVLKSSEAVKVFAQAIWKSRGKKTF